MNREYRVRQTHSWQGGKCHYIAQRKYLIFFWCDLTKYGYFVCDYSYPEEYETKQGAIDAIEKFKAKDAKHHKDIIHEL